MIASSTICGSTLTASCAVLEMIENELSKRGSCKVSYLPGKGQAYVYRLEMERRPRHLWFDRGVWREPILLGPVLFGFVGQLLLQRRSSVHVCSIHDLVKKS